jgi:hypothetical protein
MSDLLLPNASFIRTLAIDLKPGDFPLSDDTSEHSLNVRNEFDTSLWVGTFGLTFIVNVAPSNSRASISYETEPITSLLHP